MRSRRRRGVETARSIERQYDALPFSCCERHHGRPTTKYSWRRARPCGAFICSCRTQPLPLRATAVDAMLLMPVASPATRAIARRCLSVRVCARDISIDADADASQRCRDITEYSSRMLVIVCLVSPRHAIITLFVIIAFAMSFLYRRYSSLIRLSPITIQVIIIRHYFDAAFQLVTGLTTNGVIALGQNVGVNQAPRVGSPVVGPRPELGWNNWL